MPAFESPSPITVNVHVFLGDIEIIASDRTDTVVEVRPTDSSKKDDVRAAEETAVDFAGGSLTVKAPRGLRMYTPFSGNPSIDVTIEVPTGSQLHGTASVARFLGSGELGECDLKTSVGDLQLEKAGPVRLRTSGGNITVDHVAGRADITTSTGIVRVREIDGSAAIKNSNGDSVVREVVGDIQVKAANGNITVERSRGSVTAKTANGNVRVGDASNGDLRLETSNGELEVGIHPGNSAWLDVNAKSGTVQNLMEITDRPADGEEVVQVYARNSFGNIIIRQATAL
ncbi:DUF4097 family beta strand repeat-containing protein [Streptomyces sp. TLI_185]|uniref:DUF4097 family beta strand repeat-containing protein n=1 Tax=Streptomyces sp. TLI_185 TaxID=2485151 RepID=UPI000F5162C0|nr:DUF4097 family beta strand repeat-containing protein [Streptomyces sp. TLI_185]RPF24845.1 putative adhesin [Streptomyces sp. TLI_185]